MFGHFYLKMDPKRGPFSNGWGDCGDTIFLIFKMGTKSVPILKIKKINFILIACGN